MVAGRWADKWRRVGETVLQEAWGRFSKQWARHPQEVEGVGFPKKTSEGRLRNGVVAHG